MFIISSGNERICFKKIVLVTGVKRDLGGKLKFRKTGKNVFRNKGIKQTRPPEQACVYFRDDRRTWICVWTNSAAFALTMIRTPPWIRMSFRAFLSFATFRNVSAAMYRTATFFFFNSSMLNSGRIASNLYSEHWAPYSTDISQTMFSASF